MTDPIPNERGNAPGFGHKAPSRPDTPVPPMRYNEPGPGNAPATTPPPEKFVEPETLLREDDNSIDRLLLSLDAETLNKCRARDAMFCPVPGCGAQLQTRRGLMSHVRQRHKDQDPEAIANVVLAAIEDYRHI